MSSLSRDEPETYRGSCHRVCLVRNGDKKGSSRYSITVLLHVCSKTLNERPPGVRRCPVAVVAGRQDNPDENRIIEIADQVLLRPSLV